MRQPQRSTYLANFACLFAMSACSAALAEDTTVSGQELSPLLADLDSGLYSTRVKASKSLRALSAEQLANLADLTDNTSSAETVIRIMAELDNRYASASRDNIFAASAALESLVTQDRILIADGAEQSLREHSEKRTAIALQKLQADGIYVRLGAMPTNAMRMGMVPMDSSKIMQILITKEWKGGDEGLEVFSRLTNLFGPATNFRNQRIASVLRASVFLIDGHTLTERDESRLTELVGQSGLQRRSEVALGIVWDSNPMFSFSTGVVIGDVSKGGSAEQAGLREGDLLLAIESEQKPEPDPVDVLMGRQRPLPGDDTLGENRVPLRDFDDLVTRLKDYNKGDTIKMRVIRGAKDWVLQARGIRFANPEGKELEEPKAEIIDVKLMGWEKLGEEWKFPY